MSLQQDFAEIVQPNVGLAPYIYLKLGGPAEMLVKPRSREELSAVVRRCFQEALAASRPGRRMQCPGPR